MPRRSTVGVILRWLGVWLAVCPVVWLGVWFGAVAGELCAGVSAEVVWLLSDVAGEWDALGILEGCVIW